MDTITYTKEYFKGFSKVKFNRWILKHKKELATGAIFTYTDKKMGKLIKHFTKKHIIDENGFCPNHVGNIITIGAEIYVMNIIPPRNHITPLIDFLYNADFDYHLVTMAGINPEQYAIDSLKENNKPYGYLSALQCPFRVLQWLPNTRQHCSEYFVRCLQNQGFYQEVHADNVSPVQALNLLMHNRLG